MIKRTHCYVMSPQSYEISGCPVDPNHRVNWSEYEKYLWCFNCELDFLPSHNGIFDGPISMGLTTLVGISFDRINIETDEIIKNPYLEPTFKNKEVDQIKREIYNSTWAKE